MARFNDPDVPAAAFTPYLEPGEQLAHWAYGVKPPHLLLQFILCSLGVLPGLIALALLTKEYVVGLTDRRFIVLRFKNRDVEVLEIRDYLLSGLPSAKTSTGPLFTRIRICDRAKPFVAKFHRLGMPGNRQQAMAIAAVLTYKPARQEAP
jgi:hypothetical protein